MKYSEIRPQLNTFDILNCEQRNIFMRAIGHTAGVYLDYHVNTLFCLESTTMNKWTGVSGVQMNPLSMWLKNYKGRVFARQIKFVASEERCPDIYDLCRKFIRLTKGMPYPKIDTWSGRWKLICSAWDLTIKHKDIFTYLGKDKGVFCTMYNPAGLYAFCGLTKHKELVGNLEKSLDWAKEWEPDDTRDGGKFEKELADYVSLSNEIEVEKG